MDSTNGFRGGGTWNRYKLGQAQFTKWLKQTADKITPTPVDEARVGAGGGFIFVKIGPKIPEEGG